MVTDEDTRTIHRLTALCQDMSAADLERYCRGMLLAVTVGMTLFRSRFPDEAEAFEAIVRPSVLPTKES